MCSSDMKRTREERCKRGAGWERKLRESKVLGRGEGKWKKKLIGVEGQRKEAGEGKGGK